LFLLNINDITKIKDTEDNNKKSKFVLFADDTILITTSPNSTVFIKDINWELARINNKCKGHSSLKLHITSLTQFLTKKGLYIAISFGSDYNKLSNITNIKFLKIIIDNTLIRKTYRNYCTKIKCGLFCV
jgi:DNA-binding MurR/RpiR family transcriptional regulator